MFTFQGVALQNADSIPLAQSIVRFPAWQSKAASNRTLPLRGTIPMAGQAEHQNPV
jgi:hypothetical protein